MNRRRFLKIMGVFGLAAVVPSVLRPDAVSEEAKRFGRLKGIGDSWHGSEWIDDDRPEHLKDLKFVYDVDNGQWPKQTREARLFDKRPHLTANKLRKFVKMINKAGGTYG